MLHCIHLVLSVDLSQALYSCSCVIINCEFVGQNLKNKCVKVVHVVGGRGRLLLEGVEC